jgi:phage tail protein X
MAGSAAYFRSENGDTVDRIVWAHYGRTSPRLVERVLDANPGLGDHGPVLPVGVRILLPVFDDPSQVEAVRLWT